MSNKHKGWIAVDLDGTLAEYTTWKGTDHVGAPIPKMVERVQAWLQEGKDVRIFTARCGEQLTREEWDAARGAIQAWCVMHIGRALPITATKDFSMVECWDDRAVQVIPNTGERADTVNMASGTEAAVIADIARRQAHGIAKYGTTVSENPLTLKQWLQHAYEESLDHAVYLKRAMAELP